MAGYDVGSKSKDGLKHRNIPIRLRVGILKLYNGGMSEAEIASIFRMPQLTVEGVVNSQIPRLKLVSAHRCKKCRAKIITDICITCFMDEVKE